MTDDYEITRIRSEMDRLEASNRELKTVLSQAGKIIESAKNLTAPADYTTIADEFARYAGGLEGKRILDVGCDYRGLLIKNVAERFHPAEAVGINPSYEPQVFSPVCRIDRGDMRDAPYDEGAFDLIVSISAFEHVFELDRALVEMHRVLRPGGLLFTHFGPIWSAGYGHHMWFDHGGLTRTYWNTILPPFCHLLMSEDELFAHCAPRFGEALSRDIVHHVLAAPLQNKLFFEDYVDLVGKSPFEILLCCGKRGTVLSRLYQPENIPGTLDRLRARYPGKGNFYHEGMLLLLRKRG